MYKFVFLFLINFQVFRDFLKDIFDSKITLLLFLVDYLKGNF